MLKKTMKTHLICAAIALLLYSSGFLVILTPLPLIYAFVSDKSKGGVAAFVISALAVAVLYFLVIANTGADAGDKVPLPIAGLKEYMSSFSIFVFGMGYFGFFAAIALTIGKGLKGKWPVEKIGGRAIACGMGALLFTAFILWLSASGGIVSGMEGYISKVIDDIVLMNRTAGVGGAHIDLLENNAQSISVFAVRIMPSMIFVYTLFSVVINMIMARRFLARGKKVKSVAGFAGFRMPDYMVWAVISCGVLFFADFYLLNSISIRAIAVNGLIVMLSLYFFQGMAVIVYVLQGVRIPLLRMIAYVLIILFFQSISVVIVALGVADVWINFRIRKLKLRHHQT